LAKGTGKGLRCGLSNTLNVVGKTQAGGSFLLTVSKEVGSETEMHLHSPLMFSTGEVSVMRSRENRVAEEEVDSKHFLIWIGLWIVALLVLFPR
jgi:hypothetical protein